MQKISYIAHWIQWIVIGVVVPFIIFSKVLFWWDVKNFYALLMYNQMQMTQVLEVLTINQKLLVFSLEIISSVLLISAVWNFLKILKLYKNGSYFSKEIIVLLKKLNYFLLAWAVYEVLLDTFISIAISLFSPEGLRFIKVSIKDSDLLHFFIVLVLCLFFHLVQEAYKIKSEQDLVV